MVFASARAIVIIFLFSLTKGKTIPLLWRRRFRV
jgi:hypothetical protein